VSKGQTEGGKCRRTEHLNREMTLVPFYLQDNQQSDTEGDIRSFMTAIYRVAKESIITHPIINCPIMLHSRVFSDKRGRG